MSNQPPGDDDPTRSYRPFGDDAGSEPTRVERSVGHEGGNDEPTAYMGATSAYERPEEQTPPGPKTKSRWKKIAPLLALAVLVFVGGIAAGWGIFNGGGGPEAGEETTTTEATTAAPTTAPARRSTTTAPPRSTTTEEARQTTTTERQATTTTTQP